jgi:hypothetical protein
MLPGNLRMLGAALAAALLSLNAAAQQRPQDTPGPDAPSAKNPDRRGENLGERLSRNQGVIRPPSGRDSEIIVRPPQTPDKAPIKPPPGTGDKSPRDKPK